MKLERNIVALDIETTGLQKERNRILQIGLVKYDKDLNEISKLSWLICPDGDWEIEYTAAQKTGFTKEFIVTNGIPLEDTFEDFKVYIEGCDLLTYNGISFDIPFLIYEYGKKSLDLQLESHKIYDAFLIEKAVNGTRLVDAYRRYYGKEPDVAHDATEDCISTAAVFKAQNEHYDVAKVIKEANIATDTLFSEGFIDKELVFRKGKYAGKHVDEVVLIDKKYFAWLFENNILFEKTKDAIKQHFIEKNANR